MLVIYAMISHKYHKSGLDMEPLKSRTTRGGCISFSSYVQYIVLLTHLTKVALQGATKVDQIGK